MRSFALACRISFLACSPVEVGTGPDTGAGAVGGAVGAGAAKGAGADVMGAGAVAFTGVGGGSGEAGSRIEDAFDGLDEWTWCCCLRVLA